MDMEIFLPLFLSQVVIKDFMSSVMLIKNFLSPVVMKEFLSPVVIIKYMEILQPFDFQKPEVGSLPLN